MRAFCAPVAAMLAGLAAAAGGCPSWCNKWTCDAPYVDSTYGPSSGELSAADLYVELSIGQRLPENGILRFQAGREEKITATLKSSAGPMSRVSAWAFAGSMGFGDI